MDINKEEQSLMVHTLGLNYKDKSFRNHYVAGNDHHSISIINNLVEKGYMYKMHNFSGDYYCCTDSVKRFLEGEIEKSKPKLTRSQKRYKLYLSCDCVESYGEWLKSSYWNDCRKWNKVN
jgi:hypothetical protein